MDILIQATENAVKKEKITNNSQTSVHCNFWKILSFAHNSMVTWRDFSCAVGFEGTDDGKE